MINDYFIRMYGPKAGRTLRGFYDQVVSIYANPRNHPTGVNGPELDWGNSWHRPQDGQTGGSGQAGRGPSWPTPRSCGKKRFALFKFGTWDYMRQGRDTYEASKVAKASAPVGAACPVGADFQEFGGFNGWLKDNGDVSLRKIVSSMRHDGKSLYLKFIETDFERGSGGRVITGRSCSLTRRTTPPTGFSSIHQERPPDSPQGKGVPPGMAGSWSQSHVQS